MKLESLLAAALLLASGAAAPADSISIVEVRPLPSVEVRGATHNLLMHVHTFRGTRWETDEIVKAVSESAGLLAQCGVAFESSELRIIDSPRPFHYYDTPVSRQLLRALAVRKPAVFFAEDTRNDPAFDAEAIGLSNAKSRPELVNTVWIAHGARDLPHALAHELVHILTNSGEHSKVPGNLMQPDTSPKNTHLTSAQCEQVRTRGEAHGLLRRIPAKVP